MQFCDTEFLKNYNEEKEEEMDSVIDKISSFIKKNKNHILVRYKTDCYKYNKDYYKNYYLEFKIIDKYIAFDNDIKIIDELLWMLDYNTDIQSLSLGSFEDKLWDLGKLYKFEMNYSPIIGNNYK